MNILLKILKWTAIVVVVFAIGFFAFVQLTWQKTYEAPYPEIHASTDSAVIARGKYLVYGPAHCAVCHTPLDKYDAVEKGEIVPLSGGWELQIPPGTFRAPNITPDKETGIGRLTDGEIARILRHKVNKEGRVVLPFMPYQEMSTADLTAIISFLRSQEPVKNKVPDQEFSFIGKMVMALGLIVPEGPKGTPPEVVAIDTTKEYGEYIANYVADCAGCHSKRNMQTGELIGELFAGGGIFADEVELLQGKSFISPNLTPHKETGVIASWSEADFMQRIKAGRVHQGSPMPWGPFSRMNDVEIKAVYKYLSSLDPVENKIEKTVFMPDEEFPGS